MKHKDMCDIVFRQSYKLYSLQILKYCMVRLGEYSDSADDCLQNTFIAYYKKLLDGEEIKQPKAFLYRTAENYIKKTLRDNATIRRKNVPIESVFNLSAPVEDESSVNLDYDELKKVLLSNLSDSEFKLYSMKYEKNMSLKEIAKCYDIQPSAVANRLLRLRKKIISLIKPILNEYEEGGYR